MGEGIFIWILTGIISGAYTGLILSKYMLFTSLRREALRIVRRIDYIDGEGYSNYESLSELILISSDFLASKHKRAGEEVIVIFKELNSEISNSNKKTKGEKIVDAQRRLRIIPINI
ncbi:hypothetical protein [Klebsiella michiganensis]|uniref:hypothetical protein n=1 Tax=Klebsiella michiganensis TaxID=1134687 RepID=UPI00294A38E7|nr:hypothetical protein [Klebsiella michiganensis]MDV5293888.1 hypothetical protein [Klebsiella michiganensis]MDV5346155.1 hypothetical protein [Klebsiella michiganensis]MDV5446614.1 hypothetical protein [Klebsiella michiganensis]